jgi:membrane fusion protein (multidrug efflux system)
MKRPGRSVLRFTLLALVPLLVICIAVYLYAMGGRFASTDNAYVRADVVAISPEIDGRIAEVHVDDNQYVKKGQLLFTIDALPYRIELGASKAEIGMVRQEVDSLRAGFHENESEIKNAVERVRYLTAERERLRKLVANGLTSKAGLAEAEHDLQTARQRQSGLQQRRLKIIVDIGGSLDLPVEQHPRYLRAMALRNRAALSLKRTKIHAPVSGYLGDITLEPGEQVEAGDTVFPLVASGDPWVVANLKEVHLEHVKVGQTAKIHIDSYDGQVFEAVVESLSPATGAEFSLLPAQNATGNWVKVVQRVPVKLRLKPSAGMPLLRAGLTATVEIDTGFERPLGSFIKAQLASIGIGHDR